MVFAGLGFGQAGTNIVQAFKKVANDTLIGSVNVSEQDLNSSTIDNDKKVLIGSQFTEGSGKERELPKRLIGEEKTVNSIVSLAEKIIDESNARILFTAFSSAGGTGSGLGPVMTGYLRNHFSSKNVLVIGIVALPDRTEGAISHDNTLGCLKEINNLIEKNKASFILIDNEKGFMEKTDRLTTYTKINEILASTINRYLNVSGSSRVQNIDGMDKFNTLRMNGIHALGTYTKEGMRSINVIPRSSSVSRMVIECRKNEEEDIRKLFKESENISVFDYMVGYHDLGKDMPSVIHLAGINNTIRTFSESYNEEVQKALEQRKRDESFSKDGEGLNDIEKNKNSINELFSQQTSEDMNIGNILDIIEK